MCKPEHIPVRYPIGRNIRARYGAAARRTDSDCGGAAAPRTDSLVTGRGAERQSGLCCLAEACAGWTDEGDPCLSEASLGRRRSDKQAESSPQSGPRHSAHSGALRLGPVTLRTAAELNNYSRS